MRRLQRTSVSAVYLRNRGDAKRVNCFLNVVDPCIDLFLISSGWKYSNITFERKLKEIIIRFQTQYRVLQTLTSRDDSPYPIAPEASVAPH